MKTNPALLRRLEKIQAEKKEAAELQATIKSEEAEIKSQLKNSQLRAQRHANPVIGDWVRNAVKTDSDLARTLRAVVAQETRPKIRGHLETLFTDPAASAPAITPAPSDGAQPTPEAPIS